MQIRIGHLLQNTSAQWVWAEYPPANMDINRSRPSNRTCTDLKFLKITGTNAIIRHHTTQVLCKNENSMIEALVGP